MSSPLTHARQLLQQQKFDAAAAALQDLTAAEPNYVAAWILLAQAQHLAGKPELARSAIDQASQLGPPTAAEACDLGSLCHAVGDTLGAAQQFQRAAELDPASRTAWFNLGCLQNSLGEEALALGSFEQSLALEPNHAPSLHNLGQALFNLGYTDEALERIARSAELGHARSHSLLAMLVSHSPSVSDEQILHLRKEWGKQALPATQFSPHVEKPAGERIRVGYVSAYFHNPNWMKPVWALLAEHNREEFAITILSDGPSPAGSAYKPHPEDQFFDTRRLSNEELAKLVWREQIDLLVDLNGYSHMQRLPLYALHPATANITWFNTFATSGLDGFDFLIGDNVVVRPEEEANYAEKILRVPGTYLAFDVRYEVPLVAASPCQSRGAFTFGSLCSLYKLTPEVVQTWAKILQRCPDAVLLIKNAGLSKRCNREYLLQRFAEQGVQPEQVELAGHSPHYEFLQTYDRIDIALDTFPYTGGTTTSESLWQGVPVLSCTGPRWLYRVSESLLRAAKLDDWVAPSTEQYIEMAVRWAQPEHWEELATLRAGLRQQVAESTLGDTAGFARAMEELYRRALSSATN